MRSPSRFVLDSSVAIDFLRGKQAAVDEVTLATEVFLSPVVVGELLHGALNGARIEQQLENVYALTARCVCLPINLGTASYYGEVRTLLRRKGLPIPDNDIWIAATALEYGLPVVTADAHFQRIPELPVYLRPAE